ncbi:SMI1/KNR4 family protein [Streptomyces sp. NPDC005790]|uniref:SMI1/KNR4 family protein n=1 Tax=Streptomyces sp. NPDC005790 TaxID=3154777 RepID=UPI003410436D
MPSARDFATWEPVLRLLLVGDTERHAGRSVRVVGRIGRQSCSLPRRRRGRMSSAERAVVEDARRALAREGIEEVTFTAQIRPSGKTVLGLVRHGPAVETAFGPADPGVLILVDGSLPGPWRRLPDPVTGAVPAPSADHELLERTLRERLPDAIGATEEEIAAAETRLGVVFPDELRALYRVIRARRDDWSGDYEARRRADAAVGCELLALDGLHTVDAATRHPHWRADATRAVVTPPGAAVQNLAGSPGWIVFAGHGDELAIDLTPGPRGHTGQVILIDHEQSIGAGLKADSLTDLVLNRMREERRVLRETQLPLVAVVGDGGLQTIEAAAHPALEVLTIGSGDRAPFSLVPLSGLPRLRTLIARPGTLADPLEIAQLTGLEFLELGTQEWRILLDAGVVPRTLSAAAIGGQGDQGSLDIPVANELLALWDRPRITHTVLEGDLGPLAQPWDDCGSARGRTDDTGTLDGGQQGVFRQSTRRIGRDGPPS